ncbi:hypothetical protein KCU81_g113, partial [Aureobasidium melanogenum]
MSLERSAHLVQDMRRDNVLKVEELLLQVVRIIDAPNSIQQVLPVYNFESIIDDVFTLTSTSEIGNHRVERGYTWSSNFPQPCKENLQSIASSRGRSCTKRVTNRVGILVGKSLKAVSSVRMPCRRALGMPDMTRDDPGRQRARGRHHTSLR